MALTPRAYVRVPPDGAGKALVADMMIYIEYASASGEFVVGSRVTGGSSSTAGTIVQSIPITATTGRIGVHLAFPDLARDFLVNEQLLVNGVTLANVAFVEQVYVSRNQVVGANNPNQGQHVDNKGAASVRFAEGSPNLDGFGRTEVSQRTWIGNYPLTYDDLPDLFALMVMGAGASHVYDAASSTVVLTTGTAQGENVHRRSHLYHHYQAGVAQVIQMAVAIGDAGKDGVERLWGYFDDYNGAYFELVDDQLSVVLRSYTSGQVVETRVPQEQWNGDRLDGARNARNLSGFKLEPNKMYLYTIDLQWYGAGPVRFGLNIGGQRVIGHTFYNAGDHNVPFMGTGTLPIHWEQTNVGTAASASQMRVGSSSVASEGPWRPVVKQFGGNRPLTKTDLVLGERRVMSLARSVEYFKGQPNRTVALPTALSMVAIGGPVLLSIVRGGVFSEIDAWSPLVADSALEFALKFIDPLAEPVDVAGNIGDINLLEGGTFVYQQVIANGYTSTLDLTEVFSIDSNAEVRRNYDIDDEPVSFALVVEPLDGTEGIAVHAGVAWVEVH